MRLSCLRNRSKPINEMPKKSKFKTYIRPLIPFPKRKTLLKYFPSFETRNIAFLAKKYGVGLIIDVGANHGQFAEKMRSARFQGDIISFEPISFAHGALEKKSRKDTKWHIAPRMAIGDRNAEIDINIYSDSSLSSAYRIISATDEPVVERVPMRRLDDALAEYDLDNRTLLLKIDVQGFEHAVLDGAPQILKRADALMLEVSLIKMYENETPYLEMLTRLRDAGFHAVYFSPVVNRKRLGEAVQLDAFLVRNPQVA